MRDLELRKAAFNVAIPPGQIDFADSKLRQVTPLMADGAMELLENTQDEIRVSGCLEVQMETDCDRCLEPVRIPLGAPFDLYYRLNGSVGGRDEIAIRTPDSEVGFYEGDGLELNDILREQILLLLPMQRVCSESCKGFCPACGANRNQVDCGCHFQPQDDRWSALKNL
ncbi:MAG: DUF177 domain-containing protein [Bryobacteraceae bacterium]